jgi:hypothetical protein
MHIKPGRATAEAGRMQTTLRVLSEREYVALPRSEFGAPFNRQDLVSLSDTYGELALSASHSASATDQAAVALEALTADMLACVANGKDANAVVELCRDKWLDHCKRLGHQLRNGAVEPGDALVDGAWLSPATFASRALFVLAMVPDEESTVKVHRGLTPPH